MAAAKPPKITAKQQAVLDHCGARTRRSRLPIWLSSVTARRRRFIRYARKNLSSLPNGTLAKALVNSISANATDRGNSTPINNAPLDVIHRAQQAGEHTTVVLHGVTGSGKTEVYMQAIAETLRFKRQAIILVPEISLTPQTRERFLARFEHVAVLHSQLRDAERLWHWERIARGEVSVIVGARSAIFAPCPQLGLVILDEEHEGSFKQDKAPRYHARDVALFRTRAESIPLVLGSATPALETWQRAITGEAVLCDLPTRSAIARYRWSRRSTCASRPKTK